MSNNNTSTVGRSDREAQEDDKYVFLVHFCNMLAATERNPKF